MRELERAQSTATSDPAANADITVAGDMEIESESDAEDLTDSIAPPLPSVMTVGQPTSQATLCAPSQPLITPQPQVSTPTPIQQCSMALVLPWPQATISTPPQPQAMAPVPPQPQVSITAVTLHNLMQWLLFYHSLRQQFLLLD